MKRLGSVAAALIVLVALGGRDAQGQAFGFGVRGGLNYSTTSGVSDLDQVSGWKTGFHAGVVLSGDLHANVGLELDGLYTQKGLKLTEDIGGSVLEGWLIPSYIEIPVLARFRMPLGAVTPRILAGGSVAFELSCKANAEVDGTTIIDNVDCDDPLIDLSDRKKTDWSLLGGVGVEIAAGPAVLFVDAMYDLGLANLDATGLDSVKNRTWMFSLGVQYRVGGM